MKTLDEFKAFYQAQMIPQLQGLERDRITVANRIRLLQTIMLPLSILIVLGEVFIFNQTGWGRSGPRLLIYSVIGLFALYGGIYNWLTSSYSSNFKHVVIRQIITFIDASLTYVPDGLLQQAFYIQSSLFRHGIDHYTGSDHVTGVIGNINVEFSELYTYYTVRTRNGTENVKVFQGLFLVADFNKHFDGSVYVLPNYADKLLGGALGSMVHGSEKTYGDHMPMDDPDFEREFVVYGSDPVQSRYVLSTSLMKRLLDYKNKSKRKMRFAFTQNRVFMAIDYNGDLFAPKIFKTLLDEAEVQSYFDDLSLFAGVVSELNLNTRLWQ